MITTPAQKFTLALQDSTDIVLDRGAFFGVHHGNVADTRVQHTHINIALSHSWWSGTVMFPNKFATTSHVHLTRTPEDLLRGSLAPRPSPQGLCTSVLVL